MPTAIEPQPTRKPSHRFSRFRQSSGPVAPRPGTTRDGPADARSPRAGRRCAATREADRDPLGRVLEGVDGVGEADVHGQEGDVGDQRTTRPRAAGWPTIGHRAADVAWTSPPGFGLPRARGLGRGRGFLVLAQVGGRLLELGQLGDDLVVAVPLDEVGPAHVGAVLGGPAAVMPEVEVEVLDRLVERLRASAACPSGACRRSSLASLTILLVERTTPSASV